MKQFSSIEKLDRGILYALELASSISVLLLAFGLIASMANVLTKGSVLSDSTTMQRIWAWTQCIAIDASVAGTIIRVVTHYREGDKLKTWLYGLLSVLLLFTAAIVSNIESVQQTLNITLEKAYIHVFVPVELLIWIRSLSIVLIIVAHAMKHVHLKRTDQEETQTEERSLAQSQTPTSLEVQTPAVAEIQAQPECQQIVITPELVDALRLLLIQTTTISEEKHEEPAVQALPEPKMQKVSSAPKTAKPQRKHGVANYERVKAYMTDHPQASVRDVAGALNIGISTANKWMQRINENEQTTQSEQEEAVS